MDNEEYVLGLSAMRDSHVEFIASIEDTKRALAGFARGMDDLDLAHRAYPMQDLMSAYSKYKAQVEEASAAVATFHEEQSSAPTVIAASTRALNDHANSVRRVREEYGGLASVIGGGIGGIIGGGRFGGGGFSGGGGGALTAAAAFDRVAAFVDTWKTPAHWAMMLTNEIAATVGPAIVAAGAAALVGAQGGQQVSNRYQALNAVAESLGNGSIASLLGLPDVLQQAQNRTGTGGVFGLTGALLNADKYGAGNAFVQLGQSTMQMLDGAAADFTLAIKGGLGKKAAQIVAGGTQDLQEFGQVAGNIGKTFLNTAPYLPGVGQDLLGTLAGGTGLLAKVTGALGPGLLPILGYEAGARWGLPIVGTLSRALTGIGGAAAGSEFAGGGSALGELLGAGGGTLEGLGLGLGAMTGSQVGILAAATLLVSRGLSAKTQAQQQYGALASNLTPSNLVSSLGQLATGAYGTGGFQAPLGKLPTLSNAAFQNAIPSFIKSSLDQMKEIGGAGKDILGAVIDKGSLTGALHDLGNVVDDATKPGGTIHSLGVLLGLVPPPPDAQGAAFENMGKAFKTWSNTIGSASQVEALWKQGGGGAVDASTAFSILAQSGVNVNTGFGKNGVLSAKSQQEIQNYLTGYQAVTGTSPGGARGGLLSAINAVAAVGGLNNSKLSTVNSAYDTIINAVAGGAAGTAAFTQTLGGLPSTGGPPTTAAGAAWWTAFASTGQPSVVSTLQSLTDQLRTMQVLGGFSGAGGRQSSMAKYDILQAMNAPGVKGNALALSMINAIAQEYGASPVTPGESAANIWTGLQNFTKGAPSAKGYLHDLTVGTQKVASMPADAQNFVTSANNNAQTLLGNAVDKFGASLQTGIQNTISAGGTPTAAALQKYADFLRTAGFSAKSGGDIAGFAALSAGASKSLVEKIIEQVTYDIKPPKVPKAFGQIVYSNVLPKPPHPVTTGTINWTSVLGGPLPTPHGGIPFTTAVTRHAAGYRVPGFGGGDIIPAMLEPGEAVVPKHLVPSIAPFLGANRVPGFALGGYMGSNMSLLEASTGNAINVLASAVNALSQAIVSGGFSTGVGSIFGGYARTLQSNNQFGEFGRQIMLGLIEGIKNAPHETKQMAQALVSQVKTEVSTAQNLAAAAKQGQGYSPWGGGSTLLSTFGNFATPTTTAQGQNYQYYTDQASGNPLSVQQQMGDYLQAMKSFQGDIGKLSKAGLNKNLLGQLLAAGPLAGDQEAQSILSGAGGVGAANSLWGQINSTANKLGISGANAFYGKNAKVGVEANAAPVHQLQAAINSLHGKTVTIHVDVVGGSGGGGGGGGNSHSNNGELSKTELRNLGNQVQKIVLQNARMNRRSGLQLPGYGA